MLGKLMKYEWKASWKLLLPANLVIVCLSVMTWIANDVAEKSLFSEDRVDGLMSGIFILIMMLSYALSVITVFVGGYIYLLWRFYTSTYGDQGYLLHTLPVDKHHIIVAKALVSAFWILVMTLVIYMSAWLVFGGDTKDFFGELFGGHWYLPIYVGREELNVFTAIMAIVAAVAGVFAKIMQVAASASLGQLSANHKVLASFGFYIAFNALRSMLQGMISVLIFMIADDGEGILNGLTWRYSWEPALLLGLLYSAGFYLITWHVMEHKLNLE